MDRNERNCRTPIPGDAPHPAATPCARPAGLPRDPIPLPSPPPSPVPLLLCDPTGLVRCSRREALILLAGIALLATPAVAASDDPPEEDDRRRRLAARFAADPRLDQRLCLTAWSEPLEDLLAGLSAKTGVLLAFEGREVGDQRVNIVLKDQPLRRVQELLAEALDLYWRRQRRRGAYRYVLFQDLQSRKEEEALIAHARERFEEGIRRMVESLKLTPQEIEELRPKSRWWADHLEKQPPRRLAIELIGRLAPAYLEQVLQTGRVEIPFASLSPSDQALVHRFVEEHNKWREKKILERGLPPGHGLIGDMTRPGGHVSIAVLGGLPVGPGLDSVLDLGVEAADGRGTLWGVAPGYTDAEVRLLHEEWRTPRFEKERQETPPEGGPRVTITWKEERQRWETVLKELVKAADLQIVSDAYLYYWWERNEDLPDVVEWRDRPLSEVLDRVADPFFRVWRRDGDVILFRSWRWLQERRQNVPERDLRRWHAHVKASGRMALEDLVEMASLTGPQPGMVYHTGLPTRGATGHREVLRFYGALKPFQRARLQTTGLRVGELGPPQVEALRAWKPAAEAGPDSLLRLRREEKAVVFRIATEGSAPREERVPLDTAHEPTGP